MKRHLVAKTDIVVDQNKGTSNMKIGVTCTCKTKVTSKIIIQVIDRNKQFDLEQ